MTPITRRTRRLFRRPAIGVVAVLVVLATGATAAADHRLAIFGAETAAPFGFNPEDLHAMPDLRDYGELEIHGAAEPHEVPDAATAAAETGLVVPRVTALPRGVRGAPVHHVVGQLRATFQYSAYRAAKAAAAAGGTLPVPPPGLDGTTVELVAGPGTAAIWPSAAGVPALFVGRAPAPTARTTSGVSFATLADHVLAVPGMPEDLAAQLRTFRTAGDVLPLPVPEDRFTTSTAAVGEASATVLVTRDRTLAAVVWVEAGVVTVVAGSADADELLATARTLR